MFLSVIIPTYNRAHVVCEAIDSILDQLVNEVAKNIEIVVIDDGSTDQTQAVLTRYGDSINVVLQQNRGPSAARNAGCAIAKGKWLSFLDSDDLWSVNRVQTLLDDLVQLPEDVVAHICDVRYLGHKHEARFFEQRRIEVGNNEVKVIDRPLNTVLSGCGLVSSTVRSRYWRGLGGLQENIRMYEDTGFMCRLAMKGKFAFAGRVDVTARRVLGGAAPLTSIERTDPLVALQYRLDLLNGLTSEFEADAFSELETIRIKKIMSGILLETAAAQDILSGDHWVSLYRSAVANPNMFKGICKSILTACGGIALVNGKGAGTVDRS